MLWKMMYLEKRIPPRTDLMPDVGDHTKISYAYAYAYANPTKPKHQNENE